MIPKTRGRYTLGQVLQYMPPSQDTDKSMITAIAEKLKDYDPAVLARIDVMELSELLRMHFEATTDIVRIGKMALELHEFLASRKLAAPFALPQPTEGLSDKKCIKALYEVALPRTSVPPGEAYYLSDAIIIAVNGAVDSRVCLNNVIVLENSSLRLTTVMPGTIYMPLGYDDEGYDRTLLTERSKNSATVRRTSWGRLHALALEQGFI